MPRLHPACLLVALGACASAPSPSPAPVRQAPEAGQGNADLAMKLTNPVAALISVPLQLNHDRDIGPSDGTRTQLNVQPVIPLSLDEDWNLISRTIVPIVRQDEIFPGAGTQTALGDIVQSLFFSPKAPSAGGWIWGVGPPTRIRSVVMASPRSSSMARSNATLARGSNGTTRPCVAS